MKNDNGGPAFPRPATWNHNSTKIIVADDGMTLRDYFAAKALAGLLACPNVRLSDQDFAKVAYDIAAAMIANVMITGESA